MRLAIYDPTTGEIARIVDCPVHAAEGQALEGEASVEVGADISDATHVILGGSAVAKH